MKLLVLSPNYATIKRNGKWRLYKPTKATWQRINKFVEKLPFEIKDFCKEYKVGT